MSRWIDRLAFVIHRVLAGHWPDWEVAFGPYGETWMSCNRCHPAVREEKP